MRFAVIGVAGFVATRHLQAIVANGHEVVAAVDPCDSVGTLDRYGFDIEFFTDFGEFSEHLQQRPVDWVSVCSPNWLHESHAIAAMRAGANVICEKPLVLTPAALARLERVEEITNRRTFTVLQLRLHDKLVALRTRLVDEGRRRTVVLSYVAPRGLWYGKSWKADDLKSGGIIANIGVHLFDALIWLFGPLDKVLELRVEARRARGVVEMRQARVEWQLSIAPEDGPASRSLTFEDGTVVDLSDGFEALHTKLYGETLAGRGFGIEDARGAVELTYRLRQ